MEWQRRRGIICRKTNHTSLPANLYLSHNGLLGVRGHICFHFPDNVSLIAPYAKPTRWMKNVEEIKKDNSRLSIYLRPMQSRNSSKYCAFFLGINHLDGQICNQLGVAPLLFINLGVVILLFIIFGVVDHLFIDFGIFFVFKLVDNPKFNSNLTVQAVCILKSWRCWMSLIRLNFSASFQRTQWRFIFNDNHLVYRTQQPIPKLRIYNFHNCLRLNKNTNEQARIGKLFLLVIRTRSFRIGCWIW
jgi:hypothetical protein